MIDLFTGAMWGLMESELLKVYFKIISKIVTRFNFSCYSPIIEEEWDNNRRSNSIKLKGFIARSVPQKVEDYIAKHCEYRIWSNKEPIPADMLM